jgi:Glycosyltransferases involved in cell wall biogenesis
MIKNEEKNLHRCLEKLMPLTESGLAELIIVDTGSDDESVNIAKQYTDKVYFHKWNKDFSAMRNITISYAKGDWIFILDADERLDDGDKLIELMNSSEIEKYNTIIIQGKNLYTETDEDNYNLIATPRIFRNDGSFRYEGVVHNQPIFKGPNLNTDIYFTHYGYIATDKNLMEIKYKRTTELLKSELEKDPENLYYIYQLGVSYDMHRNHKESLEEFRKAYDILKHKNSQEKKMYSYIFASYSRIAYTNNEFKETIKVAKEALNYEKDYVDLYYLIAISEKRLNNDEEAFKYFNKYFDLVKRYHLLDISKNMSIIMYHIDDKSKSTAYFEMVKYYLDKEKYKDAYKIYNNITSVNEKIYSSIHTLIPLKKYSEIVKVYNSFNTEKDINKFLATLEEKIKGLEEKEKISIYKEFSLNSDIYGLFNKIRTEENRNRKIQEINEFINKADFNNIPIFYSEVFENLNNDISLLINVFKEIEVGNLKNIIKHLIENKNFKEVFEGYLLNSSNHIKDINELKVFKSISNILMLIHIQENEVNEKYLKIFKTYLEAGMSYVEEIYRVDKAELIYKNVTDIEDKFLIIMYIINELINQNKEKEALKYMLEAVKTYEAFAKYIDVYKDELFNLKEKKLIEERNKEFENYKIQVKESINDLINQGNINEAKELINQYEEIVKQDIEIFSIKAIISVMENRLDEAEAVLENGLKIDSVNFDLNYNLAYVYECKEQFLDALELYEKIIFSLVDGEQRRELIKYLNEMESQNKDKIQEQLDNRDDIIVEKLFENRKINLHLMYDSPYCEKLIKVVNDNFPKEENKFIIIHEKNRELKYINLEITKNIVIIDLNTELDKLLSSIENCSRIFIHYLFDYFCQLVCKFKIEKPIYWLVWGGDLYNYIDFELYKPETKKALGKIGANISSKVEKNTINYVYRKSTIRKISKILIINDGEYEEIKANFITKAKRKDFIYPSPTFDSGIMKKVEFIDGLKSKYQHIFLIGNSANPSNNHVDILSKLKNIKNEKFCIIAPLSYGASDQYVDLVISEGKKIFKNRFIPLIQYYSSEEYNYILNSIDVCLFSYNRQQGLGNIYTAIELGKKVFIDNNKYKFFDLNGIIVYDINKIDNINFDQIIEVDNEIIDKNKELLEKIILDEELVMRHIRNIFEN